MVYDCRFDDVSTYFSISNLNKIRNKNTSLGSVNWEYTEMGKDRRKRHRAKKSRPTGLPSVQETVAAEAELGNPSSTSSTTTFQGQSITVLEKLQSGSAEERECACTTLANLVQDASATETLLQHNIVKSLGPLLMDSRPSIREAAAGALRMIWELMLDSLASRKEFQDLPGVGRIETRKN